MQNIFMFHLQKYKKKIKPASFPW